MRGSLRSRMSVLFTMLVLLTNLTGCVAAVVGTAIGATVAVGSAVVKVPIKATGAVIDVMSDDDEKSPKKD